MADGAAVDATMAIRDIPARPIDQETFAPFGELIAPIEDGVPFGTGDAKLDLAQGTPRLYIMRLPRKGLVFRQITRHRGVTQCLAALGGKSWMLAVAPPKNFAFQSALTAGAANTSSATAYSPKRLIIPPRAARRSHGC